MSIELVKTGDNQWAVCVGKISYQAGREYPWLGCHGMVCQYFPTESEAKHFASSGKSGGQQWLTNSKR